MGVNRKGDSLVNRIKISSSDKSATSCCLNKSVFLESYGQDCVKSSEDLRIQSERCQFSQDIPEKCQQDLYHRLVSKVSKFCKVAGKSCVIQKYVFRHCDSDIVI